MKHFLAIVLVAAGLIAGGHSVVQAQRTSSSVVVPIQPVQYSGRDANLRRFVQQINQALGVCYKTYRMSPQVTQGILNTAARLSRSYRVMSPEMGVVRDIVTLTWVADYYCN